MRGIISFQVPPDEIDYLKATCKKAGGIQTSHLVRAIYYLGKEALDKKELPAFLRAIEAGQFYTE